MPNIKIDGKNYILLNKEFTFDELNEPGTAKEFADGYKQVREFMEANPEYKSVEDVLKKFSDEEIISNVHRYYDEVSEAVDRKYDKEIKAMQENVKKKVAQYYENKVEKEFHVKEKQQDFAKKYGGTPAAVSIQIVKEVMGESQTQSKGFNWYEALNKIAAGVSEQVANSNGQNKSYYQRLNANSQKAKDTLALFGLQENANKLVKQYVTEDPDKHYQELMVSDGYELTTKIDKEKAEGRNKLEKDIEVNARVMHDKWSNLKKLHASNNESRKEFFKGIIQKRNELEERYSKTNFFSRLIGNIPFLKNLTDAGKIQNEIEKIDKAVKEAGFDKNDISNVQAEIANEGKEINTNAVDTKTEDLTMETEKLHNKLGTEFSKSSPQLSQKVNDTSRQNVVEVNNDNR